MRSMENAKKIKVVIGLLAGILVFEVFMLLIMLRPLTFYFGMTLGVILIVNIYLVVLSLSLLKQLEKHKQSNLKS